MRLGGLARTLEAVGAGSLDFISQVKLWREEGVGHKALLGTP